MNIVAVIRIGSMQHGSYYYFDMELCQMNLETFIYRDWKPEVSEQLRHLTVPVPQKTRIRNVMQIMMQISSGVAYIHSHKEVHRDLKPSNGE